ncbi:MAG: cytochrome c oxidase subunit II [Firmicutes bacterium]|nr:cytochrome c oxidase subunit II [Bacillota bacterium]
MGTIAANLLLWLHPTVFDMQKIFAAQLPANNRHDLVIDVTARQWEWIFSYPQYHLRQTVNAAGLDELVIPVRRPVDFRLRSADPFHPYDIEADVIHSFWIPAFGIKEDVIPGETRNEYVMATQTASYRTNPEVRVQCAEVCGPGHPWMEAPVRIVTARQFRAWIHRQQRWQRSRASR